MKTSLRKRTDAVTDSLKRELLSAVADGKSSLEEPMAGHTTMRVGGPAEVYIEPGSGDLSKVSEILYNNGIPYMIIGNGSNLLVGDLGIPGAVLSTVRLKTVNVNETHIYADAGAMLSRVSRIAADSSLSGMEELSGIPGTIGGALRMNAGAYGRETGDIVEAVYTLTPDGEKRRYKRDELEFGYRKSTFSDRKELITGVDLVLESGDEKNIKARMRELNQKRRDKQPLEHPSAGSTFKRPEGYFAGKLIEDSGLKGYRVGGACVSEKHCGFIINLGNATAGDVRTLINEVISKVREDSGVTLEPEVIMTGEFL